ncbi:CinA family protein [Paracoccus suum]|uniref:CinA family protein n=1 Tax=Paracoccus suum TaxID=2259340 RepID=A0A344PKT2_9RHOB|nr:CinA family protein [Paracoccus suum]AXC49987.1 CinA family protein [Paracoccus suum]
MSDPQSLLDLALRKGVSVATAESCTGGLLSARLTAAPGSSAAFERGFVTYSNDAKIELLGVEPRTLETEGAVSEAVARQMAIGALTRSNARLAVSVTGIAGPGGSEHKPEGRVCFGVATEAGTRTETVEFGPRGRDKVREASVAHAVEMMTAALKEMPDHSGEGSGPEADHDSAD